MKNATLRAGTIKRIHVDKQIIAANAKYGRHDPTITIQTSKGSIKTHRATILGESQFIYSPNKPLNCGAKVWVETTAEVEYRT